MKNHVISDGEFADFAAGYGTRSGTVSLRSGQVSRRLLILRTLVNGTSSPWSEEAYGLLSEISSYAPDVVTPVVAAPCFGSWSALALRALRAGDQDLSKSLVDQLGVFAVTAAVRGGIDFSLDVPAANGAVFLPDLGRAAVSEDWITVHGKAGRYRLGDVELPADPTRDGHRWAGLRRIVATQDDLRLEVALDDLDPWRDNHGLSASDRLSDTAVLRWRGLITEAWKCLVRHHRRYAEAMAAGLRTIVPLNPPASGNTVNATSMWAFGSLSLTMPTSGLTLASSLLHEFQHAKLGALLDMFRLYEDPGDRRHYAPWRDDPRPLGGVLQGVYAFLGVTDFWRVERNVLDGTHARFADLEFARWRDQVWQTFRRLEDCDAFTDTGRQFLAGMRQTQLGWLDEPVSEFSAALAAETSEDHWTGWRLRNLELDQEDAWRLVAAWCRDALPAGPVRTRTVAKDVRARARNARLDLAVLGVNDPAEFAGTCAQPVPDGRFSPADTAYARGEYATAVAAYCEQIAADPDDQANWAGLAMAARRIEGPAAALWRDHPELPFAVHRAARVAGAPAPDPLRLGEWLAMDQVGGGSTTQ